MANLPMLEWRIKKMGVLLLLGVLLCVKCEVAPPEDQTESNLDELDDPTGSVLKDTGLLSVSDSCSDHGIHDLPHPHIILLGPSGVGKSTLANQLLGRNILNKAEQVFSVGNGAEPHTIEIKYAVGNWLGDGPCFTIIDTPGDYQHALAMANIIKDQIKSVDVFLLCFDGRVSRFDQSTIDLLKLYESAFSKEMWNHTVTEVTWWPHDNYSVWKRRKLNNIDEEIRHRQLNSKYTEELGVTIDIQSVFIDPVLPIFDDEGAQFLSEEQTEASEAFQKYTDELYEYGNNSEPFICDGNCQAPNGSLLSPRVTPEEEKCVEECKNNDVHEELPEAQFEYQRDVENLTCSTLPEFQTESHGCSVWKCGKKVLNALKKCKKSCKKKSTKQCMVTCATEIMKSSRACWPCLKWGCCLLNYAICCTGTNEDLMDLLLMRARQIEIEAPICETQETFPHEVSTLNDLNNFMVRCENGTALQGFQFIKAEQDFILEYSCCTIIDSHQFNVYPNARTSFDPSSQQLDNLAKQDVKCPGNTYFYYFHMESDSNEMWYDIGCASGNVLSYCESQNTTQISNDISDLWNLHIKCPDVTRPYLQQFQMENIGDSFQYNYTCCGNYRG